MVNDFLQLNARALRRNAAVMRQRKPCIRGHRIWVSLILDLLASGTTEREILKDYPGLEPGDIQACIAYGAEMSRERCVDVPLEAHA